jgi:2-iminobutanoate/2-iminopropanoate deaminase
MRIGAFMSSRTESNPGTVCAPSGHFSQAVVVHPPASLLFVSGQVPRDQMGRTVGRGSMPVQAEQVFANLQSILAAHGGSFADVVKFTIFVTRMDLANEVAAVRERYCGASRPASTFIGVASLKEPDWWLEVELVAALAP